MSGNLDLRQKIIDAINAFVDDFRKNPLKHRVEHSWHHELMTRLEQIQELKPVETATVGQVAVVQKEWPLRSKDVTQQGAPRRGNCDVVIFDPSRLKAFFDGDLTDPGSNQVEKERGPVRRRKDESRFAEYRDGRNDQLKPWIYIELGVNYDAGHLAKDLAELWHVKCHVDQEACCYAVHLDYEDRRLAEAKYEERLWQKVQEILDSDEIVEELMPRTAIAWVPIYSNLKSQTKTEWVQKIDPKVQG